MDQPRIFTSKSPRDLNRDAAPWVGFSGNRYADGADAEWMHCYDGPGERDPRPEYDHEPHHPVSIILTTFRQLHGGKRRADLAQAAAAWLSSLRDMSIACAWPADQTEHARAVLARTVRVEEVSR